MFLRLGRNKMGWTQRRPCRARGRAAKPLPTARLRLEVLEPRVVLDAGPLYITEFMADNAKTLADKDGDYSDWLEIYNPTASTIALDGWYLTDGADELTQWQFPDTTAGTDVPLGPGAYIKVFASKKNYRLDGGGNPVSEFHTNFKLDKDEGYLALVQPDQTTIASQYDYPRQLTGVSYGAPMPSSVVLTQGASAKVLVPADGTLGTTWTTTTFVDAGWTSATTGVGFELPRVTLPNENEANDSLAAANSAANNFGSYSSGNLYQLSVTGYAGSSTGGGDDFFKIGAMQIGDVITVTGSGSPSRSGTGLSPNLVLELWRYNSGTGQMVASDDNGGPGNDALIPRFTVATADTYYVKIKRYGSGTSGNYQLGVWLENSDVVPVRDQSFTTEAESTSGSGTNNTIATAEDFSRSWRAVQYLSRTGGNIATTGDADWYKYQLTAGDRVTINVDSTSTLDAKVSLVNSAGTVIAMEDGTSTFASPYDKDSPIYSYLIPTSGLYYVKVEGTASTTGAYNADVYLSSTTAPPQPSAAAFTGLIGTNLQTAMYNVNPTAYVRIPFGIGDLSDLTSLILRMKYDDGFVAYLNGSEVARRNAPASPAWNSTATAEHANNLATVFEDIDISQHIGLLGTSNVLAIHGLNLAAYDSDFLVLPELTWAGLDLDTDVYFTTPTPGARNGQPSQDLVADTRFSVDRGFYNEPFDVTITCNTPGAEIRYTLDGSAPTATTGLLYTAAIHVGTTTTLRAAAFKSGYVSSPVDTQTYIFLTDVIRQPVYPAGFPTEWRNSSGSLLPGNPSADYAMDPEVVNDPAYSATIINDLKSLPALSLVMSVDDWFGSGTIKGIYVNPTSQDASGAPVKLWERAMSMELLYADGTVAVQWDGGIQIHGGASRTPSNNAKHSFTLTFNNRYEGDLVYPLFGDDAAGAFERLVLRAGYNNTWTHWDTNQRLRGIYTQDAWGSDLQAAMGDPAQHGRFVHLYLNGLYWGVYDLTEFASASFAASYEGGDEDDYDTIKVSATGPVVAADGNMDAWNAMFVLANAGLATPEAYAAIQQYLDIPNFVDYMIGKFYAGDEDWDHHNWIAVRHSRLDGVPNNTLGGFQFFNWDGERVLENATYNNLTTENNANCPSRLFQQLRANAEFRLYWADRLHEHLFNDGPLTPANAAALFSARMAEVDRAVVGESARWGDWRRDVLVNGTAYLYTRDVHWVTRRDWTLNNFFPTRTANFLSYNRNASLYPATAAPEFATLPNGGYLTGPLTITNPGGAGTIWYTLDGSDPRVPITGAVSATAQAYVLGNPITLPASVRVKARILNGAEWSALGEAQFYVNPPAAAGNLAITEVNYHPLPPTALEATGHPEFTADSFQFVELKNIGSQTIDLTDVTLTFGYLPAFDFTGSGVTSLAPGQYVVVVANPTAFAARYGGGIPVAGQFAVIDTLGTRNGLGHGGDRIALRDHGGNAIHDFTYGDGGAWPGRADGKGSTLEVVSAAGDYADPDNWRSSIDYNGSPGRAGTTAAGIVVNEVVSHTDPNQPASLDLYDSIELYNPTAAAIDIGGWYLSDSTNYLKYRIPDGTVLGAGQYLVLDGRTFGIVEYAWRTEGIGGATSVEDDGATLHVTSNGWKRIAIGNPVTGQPYQATADTIVEFDFMSPVSGLVQGIGLDGADGNGDDATDSNRTFRLCGSNAAFGVAVAPAYAYNPLDPWRHYTIRLGDYPQFALGAMTRLFFANDADGEDPGNPAQVYFRNVKIYQQGQTAAAIDFRKYFGLDGAKGDDVWLLKTDGDGNLVEFVDHVDFGAAANGEAFGRWQDDSGRWQFYPMEGRTLGSANDSGGNGPRVGPLLISEVMYRPADPPAPGTAVRAAELEYVEIYNPTDAAVDLTRWRLRKDVDFDFPAGTLLGPHQTLVVVPFDPVKNTDELARFVARYPGVNTSLLLGPYDGHLDNNGGRIQLQRPDPGGPPPDDPTYYPRLIEDEIDYNDVTPWPTAADGGGSSLTRRGTFLWGDDAAAWIAASPSPGSIDLTPPTVTINQAVGQVDPTNAATINFSVVFSEPVTDFATGDVTLGGTAGATTAIVSGSGTTYNVAVSGMTGNGTVIASLLAGVAHDGAGNASLASTSNDNAVTYVPATVAARKIFYNRSGFDGNNAAANAADDGAIATDKSPLMSGPATLANYTSYTRGINGIMVDLAGAPNPGVIAAADFAFKVGNDDTPGDWVTAPAPISVSVRLGAGTGGSDRVTIIWADNAIQNQWLQVTVKATVSTGLAADDVFYFGNAIGETGNDPGNSERWVDAADETAVRTNKTGFAPAAIDNVYDFNRDRRVSASDELTARYLASTPATLLRLITPSGGAALAAMAAPSNTGILPVESASAGVACLPSESYEPASMSAAVMPTASVGMAPSAHDAALTSASWLWAYEWADIGPRKSPVKKDPAAVSAVDQVLATEWV